MAVLLYPAAGRIPAARPLAWGLSTGTILMGAANESWFFLAAWLGLLTLTLASPGHLDGLLRVLHTRPVFRAMAIAGLTAYFLAAWVYFGHFGSQQTLPRLDVGWPRHAAALFWGFMPALLTWPCLRLHLPSVWRWLLFAHAFLIAFLAAELALRAFGPVGYGLPQDAVQVDFADRHYRQSGQEERGATPPGPKPAGVRRIIALGDSVTFGAGVDLDQTYPKVLEQALNRGAGRQAFEVVNLSHSGWNTSDEWDALRRAHAAWQPDLVVLGFVLNDAETPEGGFRLGGFLPHNWEADLGWSYAFSFFRFSTNRALQALRLRPTYLEHVHRIFQPGQPGWETCQRDLREMVSSTREQCVPFLVVIFPILTSFGDYPFRAVHGQIESCARDAGAEVLDLLTIYGQHSPKELQVSFADGHPNALGHALAAQAILDAMRSRPALKSLCEGNGAAAAP